MTMTLSHYLVEYGFEPEPTFARVRNFFHDSHIHYERLAFRDAIADCFDLDMSQPKHRHKLWDQAVKALNPYRKDGNKWKIGQEDMPVDELRAYASLLRFSRADFKPPGVSDLIPPLQLAIARTLTYIRVLPPKAGRKSSDLPDADDITGELERCWTKMRRHVHYWTSKPPNLNQHALDSVADEFRSSLWIEPHEIGQLKQGLESGRTDPELMFWGWPFAIFKHATKAKIESRNHSTINPYLAIWDKRQHGFYDLWGVET